MRKKFLSLLLALVMAVMVLPMTALAADGNEVVTGTPTEVSVSVNVTRGTWESTVSYDPEAVETLIFNGKSIKNGGVIGNIDAGWGNKTEKYTFEVTFKTAGTHTITVLSKKDTVLGTQEKKGETTVVVVEPECQHTVKAAEYTQKAANCKEPGYLMDCWVCECGEWFSAETGEMVTEADCVEEPRVDSTDFNDHDLALVGEGEDAHYECTRCEKTFTKEEVDGPEAECQHEAGNVVNEGKPATCLEDGIVKQYKCKYCDEIVDEDGEVVTNTVIAATEHHFTQVLTAQSATCAQEGTDDCWQCDNCKLYFATNADWKSSQGVEKIDGFKHGKNPANHEGQRVDHDSVDPTCTTKGNRAFWECKGCDKCFEMDDKTGTEAHDASYFDIAPNTEAHKLGTYHKAIPATCVKGGKLEWYSCAEKGCKVKLDKDGNVLSSIDTEKDFLNHPADLKSNLYLGYPATCKVPGKVNYWHCGACQKNFAESDAEGKTPLLTDADFEIPVNLTAHPEATKSHVYPEKAATCVTEGNIPYWHCGTCQQNFAEDDAAGEHALTKEDIFVGFDSTNHSDSEHQTYGRVEPTCNEDGHVAYWYCEGCQKCFLEGDEGVTPVTAEDVKIPAVATSHPADQKQVYNTGYPATCKVPGKVNYWHCGACGNNYAESDAEGTKPLLTDADFEIPVNPLGHPEEQKSHVYPENIANCISGGNIAYWHCGECQMNFAESDEKGETPLTGEETKVDLDPTNHNPEHRQSWDRVEPTCTKEGMEAYWYCQDCQKCFVADDKGVNPVTAEDLKIPVDPKSHPEGMCKLYQGKEYNCEEDGFDSYWQCDACGKFYFADDTAFENPMDDNSQIWHTRLGHDWVAGEEITGVNYEVCSRCGKYRVGGEEGDIIDAIPALHTLDFHQGTPATCTEAGEMDYWYCTDEDCGLKFASLEATSPLTNTEIAPLGHDIQKVENGTWGANYPYFVCTRCGQFFADQYGQQPIDAPDDKKDHFLIAHEAKAPSCATGDGSKAYWECKVCGKFYANANGKKEVAESYWVIPYLANNATHHNLVEQPATEEYIRYFQCENCGMCFNGTGKNATVIDPSDLGNTVNAGPHSLKYYPEVPANCTTEGTKAHWECQIKHGCNVYFADSAAKDTMTAEELVISVSHNWIYFKGYEATMDAEGRLGYHYCTTCKMVKLDGSDTLYTMEEARQHWTIEKQPDKSDVQAQPKVEPTCTEEGTKKHWTAKDERTGETLYFLDKAMTKPTTQEELKIPALGHDMKKVDYHFECTRCGKWFADENGENEYVDPACKHEEGKRTFVASNATCTKAGLKDHYVCSCGQLLNENGEAVTANDLVQDALGHDVTGHVAETETTYEYWYCVRTGCGKRYADAAGTRPLDNINKPAPCKHESSKRTYVACTATCTKAGMAEHYVCSCGQLLNMNGQPVSADDLYIGRLPHKAVDHVAETETTVEYWICSCGGKFSDAACTSALADIIKDTLDGMDHDLDLGGNWGLSTNGGKDKQP